MMDNDAFLELQSDLILNLFKEELREVYWTENHLVRTYPMMKDNATTDELSLVFYRHLQTAQNHVDQLERVFQLIPMEASSKKGKAMEGIISETDDFLLDTNKDSLTNDLGLIFAAQKAEHYEIAAYSGLVVLAKALQLTDAGRILRRILEEEKDSDSKLTEIAETLIRY